MRRIHIVSVLTILIMSLVLTAVATPPASAIMLVSRSQAERIGKQVEQQIIRQYGGLSDNVALTNRVQRIGNEVAEESIREDVNYTFRVLDSEVVNAFAAPGGPVLITEGLAEMLTDQELAFVLAHEVGHIAAQHGREAINRALIAQGIFSLLFRSSSRIIRTGIGIMYTLYERGYSRDQEYQADEYGLQFMTDADYGAEGAVSALAKLGMGEARGLNRYFATHPAVPDRIDRIANLADISDQRKQQLIQSARE